MSKILSIFSILTVICFSGFSNDETSVELYSPFTVSITSGPQSFDNGQSADVFLNLENRRFFLWRWLFGTPKNPNGAKSRVSPTQGVTRARLAKPRKNRSASRNPAQIGSSSNPASSNSRNPANIGSPGSRVSSRSVNPASVGSSSQSAESNSVSPVNYGGTSSGWRSRSSSSIFGNQPRPPLSPSLRDEYFGNSQRELGLSFGSALAFTDITGTKAMGVGEVFDHHFSNPDFTIGGFARFRVVDWFGLSLGLDYANFSGVDQSGNALDFEGYSFENQVYEFGGKVEFFIPMKYGSPFDIYGFSGLSVLYNNPRLFDSGGNELVIEQSVNMFQPAIPFGFGLNIRLVPRVKFGFETGYRYLVYNFLDGVMVTGSGYDSYLFNQIKVSYSLRPPRY